MPTHEELKARAAATYNAAADWYDAPANTFWARFGRDTVTALELRPGMRVLDVCSGSGASAIPAAEGVGPTGRVLAVDLAQDLLALLAAKARRLGLTQLEVRRGDLMELDDDGPGFDAVICVFGIFFVGDMVEGVRRLWRHVAPGGRLAVTTWGPRLFEPANSMFWTAVGAERPDLVRRFNPWDAITTAEALEALLHAGGAANVTIVEQEGRHAVATPEDWWALVMGSGYRGTVEQLAPDARERVRKAVADAMTADGVAEVAANVIFATATKSAER